MVVIATEEDVRRGLAELLALDPRLVAVARAAGPLPLRRSAADFRGLARIVTGQQVSVASASAIFSRLEALADPFAAETVASLSAEDLAAAGLSRPKIRTLKAVSDAVLSGLDLAALAEAPAGEAHGTLCAIHGIGPWTADIFLLFCAGHPDVFPAGDIALQHAAADVLGLDERPAPKLLGQLAEAWSPWRGVAARLLWAHYRVMRSGRETLPV